MAESNLKQTETKPKRSHAGHTVVRIDQKELTLAKAFSYSFEIMDYLQEKYNIQKSKSI